MTKMKVALIALLAMTIFGISACSKKSSSTTTPIVTVKTVKEKVTAVWKLTIKAKDANGNNMMDESEKEAFTTTESIEFYADGTGVYKSVNTESFTWELKDNDTKISVLKKSDNETITFNIVSLTDVELVFWQQFSSTDPKIWYTCQKQ